MARWWDDLSKTEARAILDARRASQPAMAAAAAGLLAELGAEQVDFSVSSLNVVWPLAVAHFDELPEGGDLAELDSRPAWVQFQLAAAEQLGPERIRFASMLGAYVAEVALRSHPLVGWTLGKERGGIDFQQPLLMFGPLGGCLDPDGLVVMALEQATNPESRHYESRRRSDGLSESVSRVVTALMDRLAGDADPPPRQSDGIELALVEQVGSDFRFQVMAEVDDELGEHVDRALVALVQRADVTKAEREDRELIYVKSTKLDVVTLSSLLDRAFAEVERASPSG